MLAALGIGVIGTVLVVILVIAAILFFLRRRLNPGEVKPCTHYWTRPKPTVITTRLKCRGENGCRKKLSVLSHFGAKRSGRARRLVGASESGP